MKTQITTTSSETKPDQARSFTVRITNGSTRQAEVLRQYLIDELADKLTDIFPGNVPGVDISSVGCDLPAVPAPKRCHVQGCQCNQGRPRSTADLPPKRLLVTGTTLGIRPGRPTVLEIETDTPVDPLQGFSLDPRVQVIFTEQIPAVSRPKPALPFA